MRYQVIKAPDALKEIVRSFWVLESEPTRATLKTYQSMADDSAELILPYGGGFEELSAHKFYLRAQKSIHQPFTLSNSFGMLGVRLYPHAISEILRIPASELCNQTYDANVLFGNKADQIAERVLNTPSAAGKIEIVSEFLIKLSLVRKRDPMGEFIKLIIQHEGQIDLTQLLHRSGYSQRHFERLFMSSTGFSPKRFARIARYHSTKRKYATGLYKNLSTLAQACGYYDQSYFIREFKEFSGWHPSRYFNLIRDSNSEDGRLIKGLIVAKDQFFKSEK
ncbi:MAG TPA: AraC family transcriptional regulator [Chryseolinea sp.]|nr:AraC family transcriptional regulator [Chryseolinea sp.]